MTQLLPSREQRRFCAPSVSVPSSSDVPAGVVERRAWYRSCGITADEHGLAAADAETNDGLDGLCAHVTHWTELASEFLHTYGFSVRY